MGAYAKLFSPIRVGGLELPNRVIMPSMGSNLTDTKGRVTQKLIDYYLARARGRPGLMVVEAACVHRSGRVIERNLMNDQDSCLDGLRRLAGVLKDAGQIAILQIIHGGRNSHPGLVDELLAPSAVRGPTSKATPRAMTHLEIEAVVGFFARAAERALEAGFAGVEIHGAHEYLVHQFLTPYCNRRSDAYGGGVEERCRFALDVVRALRRVMGQGPILSFRLSGDDHVKKGLTPDEAARIAVLLAQAGVDLISVTGGVYETPHMVVPPLPTPPGTHLAAAARIRREVDVPVAGVGRIKTAQEAEEALESVDLVAVGRAFLADPQWLVKSSRGREKSIRPCVGCNQGCIDHVLGGMPMACVCNPWLGREAELAGLEPVEQGTRAVVVGGGLAGLETALTLGRLGHQVVLFEAERRLGGQALLAAVPPGKEEFQKLVDFYVHALEEMDTVEVRLGQRASVQDICRCNPQVVVVATGSQAVLPNIPGADQAPLVNARQVLAGQAQVGKRVAVLGGGNLGSEVAHLLASQGHEVCIIELGLSIGADIGPARRYLLRRGLGEHKVRRYVLAQVRRLYPDRVSFLHIGPDGTRQLKDVGPLDTFVAALGARPNEELYLALEPKVKNLYLVGDVLSPARMGEATSEGLRVALEIHRRFQEGSLAPQPAEKC